MLKLLSYVKPTLSQTHKLSPSTNTTREIPQQATKVTLPDQEMGTNVVLLGSKAQKKHKKKKEEEEEGEEKEEERKKERKKERKNLLYIWQTFKCDENAVRQTESIQMARNVWFCNKRGAPCRGFFSQ